MECSVEGCTRRRKYKATGWCQTHYHRNYRTGTTRRVNRSAREDITYRSAHSRVQRFFGPASTLECIDCGGAAREWAYDGTDPSERSEQVRVRGEMWPVTYSVWPEFYMPLCFGCHRRRDAGARAASRTHCFNGLHPMTPENTYERPSRPGRRECVACREAGYRRRRRRTQLPSEQEV